MSRDIYQKRKEPPDMDMSRNNYQNRKKPPALEMSRGNGQKGCVYKYQIAAPKSIFKFHSQENLFFQQPAFYIVHPCLITLLLPWTIQLVPTVWTLAIAKTDLDDFFGPNMIPTTGM